MRQTFTAKINAAFIVLVAAVLVIPTTIFVPNVMAAEYLDSVSQNAKNVKQLTENIVNQQAQANGEAQLTLQRAKVIDQAKAETEQEIKKLNEQKQKEAEEKALAEAKRQAEEAAKREAQAKADAQKKAEQAAQTVASKAIKNPGYLLGVTKPDYKYVSYSVSLTEEDRSVLEHLVMGEAGNQGFVGCALVAQAIRDTMIRDGVPTVEQVRTGYGYCGGLNNNPNQDVLDAIEYIFDQGGAAVQHNLMYFYETRLCSSDWHETQNYVVTYNTTKFFDRV